MHLRRPLAALSAVIALAGSLHAQPSLDSALAQLRTYTFGADAAPLEAIDRAVFSAQNHPAQAAALAQQLAAILDSQASYDAKQFVCRHLVLIATDAQVPALARLLGQPDPALAHLALYTLNGMQGPTVDQALRDALTSARGNVRLGVLSVLGNRQDAAAARHIIPLLQDPDTATATAAATALGRIGGAASVKGLLKTYPTANPALKPDLANALLHAADNAALRGDLKTTRSVAEFLDRNTTDDRIRAAALRALVLARGDKALPSVLEALADAGTARQSVAAELARTLPGARTSSRLAATLPNPGPTCPCGAHSQPARTSSLPVSGQLLVLAALADRRDPTALDAVLDAACSPEPTVALQALQTAGALGNGTSVPRLLAFAAASNSPLATSALAALQNLRGPEVDAALLAAAEKPAPALQVAALRSLGNRATPGASATLLRATADSNRQVRTAALRVLRDLAGPADLPPLVDRLLAAAPAERAEVASAIIATARRQPEGAPRTAALLQRLPDARTTDQRATLIDTLGQLGGPEALTALRQALKDPHPDVRLAALRQLAEWPTPEPIDDLLTTIRSTTDDQQHAVALRGFIRLSAGGDPSLLRLAIDHARTDEEKRLVLAGLAQLRSREALDQAAGYARNAALRAEAELAMVSIAQGIAAAWPQAARDTLTPIAEQSANPTAQGRAREALALIGRLGDYLTAWEVSPAYSQGDLNCSQLFDTPFAPEIPDQAASVRWQLMPPGPTAEQPWLMDLLAVHGGEQKVAYLRTTLTADAAQTVTLELGSDDGAKLWLNGEVVFANNTQRAAAPAQDRATLALKPGPNTLLLKITQNNAGWAAVARLVTPAGSAPTGVRPTL